MISSSQSDHRIIDSFLEIVIPFRIAGSLPSQQHRSTQGLAQPERVVLEQVPRSWLLQHVEWTEVIIVRSQKLTEVQVSSVWFLGLNASDRAEEVVCISLVLIESWIILAGIVSDGQRHPSPQRGRSLEECRYVISGSPRGLNWSLAAQVITIFHWIRFLSFELWSIAHLRVQQGRWQLIHNILLSLYPCSFPLGPFVLWSFRWLFFGLLYSFIFHRVRQWNLPLVLLLFLLALSSFAIAVELQDHRDWFLQNWATLEARLYWKVQLDIHQDSLYFCSQGKSTFGIEHHSRTLQVYLLFVFRLSHSQNLAERWRLELLDVPI